MNVQNFFQVSPYELITFTRDTIRDHFFLKVPVPEHDFSGQTIIVTGANIGLGLEAARHFTRLNAEKVILGVRSVEKGEAAKESIEGSTKRPGVVEVWQLDLSSYESTRQFANRAAGLSRLDALVENAGVAKATWSLAEDNETTITVNVVNTVFLALLLLPKLRDTASRFNVLPRLTFVNSELHFLSLCSERKYPKILEATADRNRSVMIDRYNLSKLFQVLYIRALLPRLAESRKSKIILNYLTPGLCHSELGREHGNFFYVTKLGLARSTEEGSRSLVFAVAGGEETHGHFLRGLKPANPSNFVLSDEGLQTGERLYQEISEKLESLQPGITQNI